MLCFRVGCPCAVDDADSVMVEICKGTRAAIGTSKAWVRIYFCSVRCMLQFFQELNETGKDILDKVKELTIKG